LDPRHFYARSKGERSTTNGRGRRKRSQGRKHREGWPRPGSTGRAWRAERESIQRNVSGKRDATRCLRGAAMREGIDRRRRPAAEVRLHRGGSHEGCFKGICQSSLRRGRSSIRATEQSAGVSETTPSSLCLSSSGQQARAAAGNACSCGESSVKRAICARVVSRGKGRSAMRASAVVDRGTANEGGACARSSAFRHGPVSGGGKGALKGERLVETVQVGGQGSARAPAATQP
jgi:hypothetical protein